MKNILKKTNSKWFLLFLCTFFSLTMQAQWEEGGSVDQIIEDDGSWADSDPLDDAMLNDIDESNTTLLDEVVVYSDTDDNDLPDILMGFPDDDLDFPDDEPIEFPDNELPPKDFVSSVDPKDCGPLVCGKYLRLVPEECRCEATPRPWYLDSDGDGWFSQITEAKESPGANWKKTTSGKDCYDNDPLITNDCYKYYYVDNDGDDWDGGTVFAADDNGGKYKTTTLGSDCDDNLTNVQKLNKCGKCEVEPESTDWKISDVIDNATGLLKEMIDKAKQIAPKLNIIKSGDYQGAKTRVKCAEIKIGENNAEIKSNALLAFELSHILNTSLSETTNTDGLFALTRNDYIKTAALFEAEGFIFSQIIKNTEAKTLNDCEKNLLGITTLKQDYSNLTVDQIKNQIRQNGELDSQAQNLIDNGIVSSTGKTFVQKYGKRYDDWQKIVIYYRNVENLTNNGIKNLLPKEDCNN